MLYEVITLRLKHGRPVLVSRGFGVNLVLAKLLDLIAHALNLALILGFLSLIVPYAAGIPIKGRVNPRGIHYSEFRDLFRACAGATRARSRCSASSPRTSGCRKTIRSGG